MKDRISGTSTLLLALLENQFEAATRFLDANTKNTIAEATELSSLRSQLSQIEDAPAELIESFFAAWKSQNSADVIVKELLEAGCSLECVLLVKDPRVTQEFLFTKQSIDVDDSNAAVQRAVDSVDVQNLRVLLADGPDVETRRRHFTKQVCKRIQHLYPNLHFPSFFVEQPKPFSFNDEFPVEILYKPELLLILQYDKVYNHFERNLLRRLFADQHREVIELLYGKKMNLARVDPYNRMLRHAMRANFASNVQFLLDIGANLEFGCGLEEYVLDFGSIYIFEMLLRAGADIQKISLWWSLNLVEYVLAQLALHEIKGVPLKEEVNEEIQLESVLANHYEKCREQVEWMKTIVIFKRVTVFDALTDDVEKLAKCQCLKENILRVLMCSRKKRLVGYYYSALEEQLYTAVAVQGVRRRAAEFIRKSNIGVLGFIVVDKIMGLLSLKDLRFFALPVDSIILFLEF